MYKHEIGVVIDGTGERDNFIDEATVDFANDLGWEGYTYFELPSEGSPEYDTCLFDMAESALEYLNTLDDLPPYTYYIIHDKSLILGADVMGAREDLAVYESSYNVPFGFTGLWLRYNAIKEYTLFSRDDNCYDSFIWNCVDHGDADG